MSTDAVALGTGAVLAALFSLGWALGALGHRCRPMQMDVHLLDEVYQRGVADGLAQAQAQAEQEALERAWRLP